jgi:hypothetical protein
MRWTAKRVFVMGAEMSSAVPSNVLFVVCRRYVRQSKQLEVVWCVPVHSCKEASFDVFLCTAVRKLRLMCSVHNCKEASSDVFLCTSVRKLRLMCSCAQL